MSGPTNAERAAWAANALDTFSAETFGGSTFAELLRNDDSENGDAYCAAQDLICDVLHLAVEKGWDVGELMRRAESNFVEELTEENQS